MSVLLLQRPLNVTTTDTSRARTFYPFCVFFGVFCLFAILLSVHHFTASDFLFGIVKLFLHSQYIINIIVLILPVTTDFMNQFSTAFSIFIRFPL